MEVALPGAPTGGSDMLVRTVGKVVRVDDLTEDREPRASIAVMILSSRSAPEQTRCGSLIVLADCPVGPIRALKEVFPPWFPDRK